MSIKHLVLPGGCVNGIKTLGILKHLSDTGVINVENIVSIDATSIGSVIAILIALKFSWTDIIDYVVKRPWHETIDFSVTNVVSLFTQKGFYDEKLYKLFFKPFFDAKEISMDITFIDFYNLTNVDLHFYSLSLNRFEIIDLNHIDFPNLPIMKAVQMTSAIPVLIEPVFYNDEYFVDGAYGSNYPLKYCLQRDGIKEDEVVGIYNEIENKNKLEVEKDKEKDIDKDKDKDKDIDKEKSFFEYIIFFSNQLLRNTRLKVDDTRGFIKHEIVCPVSSFSMDTLTKVVKCESFRQELLDDGIQISISQS
jgi:predicted acylesterase/phospholipase RssA